MIRWIVINRKQIETLWFSIGSFGLASMLIINILLLQRLIQADFKNKNKNTIVADNNNKKECKNH